jgi:cytochrome c-type protein NapB
MTAKIATAPTALLALALAACAGPSASAPPAAPVAAPAAAPQPPPEPPGTKDTELGLSKTSVFDVAVPPPVQPERSEPGEKPVLPRYFEGAPPTPPHELVDYTPITPKENACLGCHEIPGPKKAGEPTPLPKSHYVDYRRAPDKVGKKVAGARWVCTACHPARTDQAPLVKLEGE